MTRNLDNSGIRGVFFDLAGTLIRVRGGIGAQYALIAGEFGVSADPVAIDRAFGRAFASAGSTVFARPDAAEVASLEKGFWKEVVRLVFAQTGAFSQFNPGDFDRCFERLFDYFATAAGWDVYPDVVPSLERLKREGRIVGLITNFDLRVFKLIDALHLSRLIDSVTVPGVAGAAKPDAAIFDFALARHDLGPRQAIHVGDSIGDDVEGANAAGMKAVLLDRRKRVEPPPGVVAIASLEELPALLE